MSSPFNSPVESAVRVLTVLAEAYPRELDVDQLVILDHILLNTEDLSGPKSLHPALPTRIGQLATKRGAIRSGLTVLLRANLVEPRATDNGLYYSAVEEAQHFLDLLESPYAEKLTSRAQWAVRRFGDLTSDEMRTQLRGFFHAWVEEFDLDESTRRLL